MKVAAKDEQLAALERVAAGERARAAEQARLAAERKDKADQMDRLAEVEGDWLCIRRSAKEPQEKKGGSPEKLPRPGL